MKLTHFLIFLASLFSNSFIISQESSDSLKVIWLNESEEDSVRFNAIQSYYDFHYKSLPDSVLLLGKYHYKLALKKGDLVQQFRAKNKQGNIYNDKNQIDSAINEFEVALEKSIQLQDSSLNAMVLGNLGISYSIKRDFVRAIRYYSDALEMYENVQDERGRGRMINNLGGVYQIIGDNDLVS